MGKGSKHNLSKEVIAALPNDLDSQLDVASQITNYAVSGRVAKLEAETANLRQKVAEKEQIISGLQKRVIAAETTLEETTAKLNIALEGQVRLHLVPHESLPARLCIDRWMTLPSIHIPPKYHHLFLFLFLFYSLIEIWSFGSGENIIANL